MQQVVVTGIGLVCPLGAGVDSVWRNLLESRSGIAVDSALGADLSCRIAGKIPALAWGPQGEPGRGERVFRLAMIAASEALDDANWCPLDYEDQALSGVSLGSGCGGFEMLRDAALGLGGPSTPWLPRAMIHHLAAELGISFNLFGPRRAVSTACAAGAHAIGDAARLIRHGDASVMLAGGAEAAVSELAVAGFAAVRALSSSFNNAPERASRPWDRDRDGFVMGEGAGMVVLEAKEHARARGARIYAELAGYGLSGDAWHITAASESGDGAIRAMKAALKDARLQPEAVQYVNAHATSTPMGDDLELAAVEHVFEAAARGLAMSSTKSATGHLLGAAGAVEAIFSILSIKDQVAPPTLNLDRPSQNSPIDRVPWMAQQRPISAALSNSFGFGGSNAALVFRAASCLALVMCNASIGL